MTLIHKPDLLILDEPTSGVDPVTQDLFWNGAKGPWRSSWPDS